MRPKNGGSYKVRLPYGSKNAQKLNELLTKYVMTRWTKKMVDDDRASKGLPPLLPPKERFVEFLVLPPEQEAVCQAQIKEWKELKEAMNDDGEEGGGGESSTFHSVQELGEINLDDLKTEEDYAKAAFNEHMKDSENSCNMDHRANALYSKMTTHLALVKRKLVLEKIKTEALARINVYGDKILFWAHRQQTLQALVEFAKENQLMYIVIEGSMSRKKRRVEMKKFQAENSPYKLAILSLTAAGAGVTLTKANVAFFCETLPISRYMSQAEDRIYRISQMRKTHIRYYIVKNTIDEMDWDLLCSKTLNVLQIIDGIKMTKSEWAPQWEPQLLELLTPSPVQDSLAEVVPEKPMEIKKKRKRSVDKTETSKQLLEDDRKTKRQKKKKKMRKRSRSPESQEKKKKKNKKDKKKRKRNE
jgi:SNF2 family DNA or RNA helicase